MVGAAGDAPVPGGHGGFGDGGVGGEGGVDDGEAGASFEVGDEGGAELGVGGKSLLVGGFEEELEPALALLVGDAFAEVVFDHVGVSAVVGGIVGGAAEDLADEGGYVLEMLGRHLGEERGEQRVGGNFFVEAGDEGAERFCSAEPFIKGGDHGWILAGSSVPEVPLPLFLRKVF